MGGEGGYDEQLLTFAPPPSASIPVIAATFCSAALSWSSGCSITTIPARPACPLMKVIKAIILSD